MKKTVNKKESVLLTKLHSGQKMTSKDLIHILKGMIKRVDTSTIKSDIFFEKFQDDLKKDREKFNLWLENFNSIK